METQKNDGGRSKAGYVGSAGDCVVRAIAIVSGKDYQSVYDDLFRLSGKSPRQGVSKKIYHRYLLSIGFRWTPCMFIGSGCKVHLKKQELPDGKIICRLSKHLAAVIDGVIHDTFDPSRNGTRCVYGFYSVK